MLTKKAIDHLYRAAPVRPTLQGFLDGRKFARKGRGEGKFVAEYLQVVTIDPATINPAPYVYEPMKGHQPGRKF